MIITLTDYAILFGLLAAASIVYNGTRLLFCATNFSGAKVLHIRIGAGRTQWSLRRGSCTLSVHMLPILYCTATLRGRRSDGTPVIDYSWLYAFLSFSHSLRVV